MTSLASSFGPWAVITGASSGLGRGFAEHLARDGVNVVLAARSTAVLEDLAGGLAAEHGVRTRVVTVDLSHQDGARRLVDATADLDVGLLVSNAGAGRPGRYLDQDPAQLDDRTTLNVLSHRDLAHAFGTRLVARGGGGMILVAALGATRGLPNMAHESASKSFVHSLGEALHHELRPSGVTVTVMLPGNVDTPIVASFGMDGVRMPLGLLPVDTAIRQTLAALRRGRPRIVPDRRMRVLDRLLPRALSVRLNGRMLGAAAAVLADRERVAAEAAAG